MEQNFNLTRLPSAASSATWSNPTRITTEDGSSSVYFPGGAATGSITGSSFDFPDLPPGAIIDGLVVSIDGSQTDTTSTVALNISGSDVKVAVYDGSVGASDDLWGLDEITEADLATLAVTVAATTGGAAASASIDYLSVTIYFHIDFPSTPADVPTRIAYKVYSREGTYLGELPDVSSKFAFAQDINSAGSSITVVCGKFVNNEVTVSPLLTEAGDPITTEDDEPITATSTDILVAPGNSPDDAIFKNSNRVKVWVYNQYYPNGKLEFSGQINRIEFMYGTGDASVKLTIYSDGVDMANMVLIPKSSYSYTTDVSQTTESADSTLFEYTEGLPDKGATTWFRMGQTIRTGAITKLGGVELKLNGTADVTVSLYSSVNGTLLGTVTKAITSPVPTVHQIDFLVPIPVTASTDYFMTVKVGLFQIMEIHRSTTNVYANGRAYQSSSGGWTARSDDLYFVTKSATAGNTTTTYTSEDPISGILSDAISEYNESGGFVKERDFTPAGYTTTYTFNLATIFDVFKKAIELAPPGYYGYVDLGLAKMDVKEINSIADFAIVRGRHINQLNLALTIEQVKNYLLFSGGDTGGGDNLYREYPDDESIGNYGIRAAASSDNRVTLDATANAIGETFIAENAEEAQETTLTVLNTAIDISLLVPGKTIGFRNFGNFIDNMVLQIVRREPNYSDGISVLTLGRLPVPSNDEIQRINRGLLDQQTINNPSAPS